MLVERSGAVPRVDPGASVAPTAVVVGDVAIAHGCYLGHGVVIESGGPPVRLERDVVVMANTVIRSLGGKGRPESPSTSARARSSGRSARWPAADSRRTATWRTR